MGNQPVTKEQASRRLIHSAIRMYARGEDQYALHLMIQSADKILLDLAKHRGVELYLDWEKRLPKEFHKEFFAGFRRPYNFLKHADKDPDEVVDWDTIADFNLLQLGVCCRHFKEVFGYSTRHMDILSGVIPIAFFERTETSPEVRDSIEKILLSNAHMTFGAFLRSILDRGEIDPKMALETAEDLRSSNELLGMNFAALRAKYKKQA
jgi:hypothetical protein